MNRGAALAQEKLAARGARAALARGLKVDPGRVSRFLSGEQRPNTTERAYIEDNYEIGWRLWDEEIEPNETAPDSGHQSDPAKPTGTGGT